MKGEFPEGFIVERRRKKGGIKKVKKGTDVTQPSNRGFESRTDSWSVYSNQRKGMSPRKGVR